MSRCLWKIYPKQKDMSHLFGIQVARKPNAVGIRTASDSVKENFPEQIDVRISIKDEGINGSTGAKKGKLTFSKVDEAGTTRFQKLKAHDFSRGRMSPFHGKV